MPNYEQMYQFVTETPSQALSDYEVRTDWANRYWQVRQGTEALCQPLSTEDCQAQSMTEASPAKWHLAHTSWFFETFILIEISDCRFYRPEFQILFNSYYNRIGDQYPRSQRGLLTRPSLEEIYAYRQYVDRAMEILLDQEPLTPELTGRLELGLHHEQQHQELLLTDVKHLFSCNPLYPAYREAPQPNGSDIRPLQWHQIPEGIYWIGHQGQDFAFDNERPCHRTFLEPFELASRPITNREYLEFIEAGGYRRPELWLAEGWDAVQGQGWQAPLYWEWQDGNWFLQTLSGLRELRGEEPVCHVSFYEADAFAQWAGARLPTEAEWEVVARNQTPNGGNLVESGYLHPIPACAAEGSPGQLFGDVWEWTRSAYSPYPGYQPPDGAIGEYNGKFMCNQMVLRGGSCATPQTHIRATYRNFFPPDTRWQFSGIRLARDGSRG